MVEDLLRGFAVREWSGAPNFATLEKLPADCVSHNLRRRHGDLLWRLRFCDAARRQTHPSGAELAPTPTCLCPCPTDKGAEKSKMAE